VCFQEAFSSVHNVERKQWRKVGFDRRRRGREARRGLGVRAGHAVQRVVLRTPVDRVAPVTDVRRLFRRLNDGRQTQSPPTPSPAVAPATAAAAAATTATAVAGHVRTQTQVAATAVTGQRRGGRCGRGRFAATPTAAKRADGHGVGQEQGAAGGHAPARIPAPVPAERRRPVRRSTAAVAIRRANRGRRGSDRVRLGGQQTSDLGCGHRCHHRHRPGVPA